MLGNDGIREALATGRYPEALLQSGEGQGPAALGLLQEGEHQLKGGHPHRHIEGLHHQSGRAIAITAGQQLLPEVPPALIRKQVALIAAMQQRSGLGPQPIDQVLQIDAPGPLLAQGAIGAGQLADPVAAQEHHQAVVMQPHRDLAADQGGRHRVHHLGHPNNSWPIHGQLMAVNCWGPLAAPRSCGSCAPAP